MNFKSLITVLGFLAVLGFAPVAKAQNNCIAISINEYCASNIPNNGFADAFGELSDWVELKCNFTNSVSLASYYLSNDRNNLFKWKFPADFVMMPGSIRLVWLSGRNTVVTTPGGKEVHANFTLEQCRNQWLILSNSAGVVRDSVYVRSTMGGHSWGRVDCFTTGAGAFKLYIDAAKSPGAENGTINYSGYAPTPQIVNSIDVNQNANKTYKGGFFPAGAQLLYFELESQLYDSAGACYDIFYTEDGSYPVPGYPPVGATKQYANSDEPIAVGVTEVVRAIAVPKPLYPRCNAFKEVLPSFCESNTYLLDPNYQSFQPEFGVISVSMDENWFLANGAYATTVHVEYFDNKNQVTEGYAMIDRPITEVWATKQKGFNISIDDRFGYGCDFKGPIFNVAGLGVTTRTVFPTLHLKSGDLESHSQLLSSTTATSEGTAIRDVFIQSLAAKYDLHVNPLHIKPVIGFINGNYSGVYDLREVFDKYYENFYNGQSMDSLDLNVVHQGLEGNVKYWDNSISTTPTNNFKSEVYDIVMGFPMSTPSKYNAVMEKLDKESFIDYMILNSYMQNQDLFKNNVGFARGHDKTKPGHKWHYYLYNTPSTLSYTAYLNPGANLLANPSAAPCYIHNNITTPILPLAYDGHGNMLTQLMGKTPNKPTWGNAEFQKEYVNRYLDLLNGPFKCENILAHFDYVADLFRKEMKCHEDAACDPGADFPTVIDSWDTNVVRLRKVIEDRCFAIENQFSKKLCYGLAGPFDLTVDVRPAGTGMVKLNSLLLDNYVWKGKYYQSNLTFQAIPTSSNYAFHHWELLSLKSEDNLRSDSITVNMFISGEVVAVFTDKTNDLSSDGDGANIPTGFTPNGDGINDLFRPLGSAEYADQYQISIFNRWGQEVFRSTDPLMGWDGNYNGSQALTGVYAYVITYKNTSGEAKVVKGNITLTR